jgi:methionyl aminopeptidase
LTQKEIEKMRVAGQFAAGLLDQIAKLIRPGLSTGEIDRFVAAETEKAGGWSAPFGYQGFPRHCCTSINEVVCHGIPDDRRLLKEGDIINVDVTPVIDGYYGDCSRTFLVGEVTPLARALVEDTFRAMWIGIGQVKVGGHVGEIGRAIQGYVEPKGYSVVREFTGHGIGREFHCPPTVFHHMGPGMGDPFEEGHAFTIEPMINIGRWKTRVLGDGWTAVTADGSLSAQFEHTVALTPAGLEVFTLGKSEVPYVP